MALREILLRWTGVGQELEELGLSRDNFSGLYDLSLLLTGIDSTRRTFFFSSYEFLRTLDDLVDLGDPREAIPILEGSLQNMSLNSEQLLPTGSAQVDASIERIYSYKEVIPNFEVYLPQIAKLINLVKEDATRAIERKLMNTPELKERAASLLFPAYQILLYTLGGGEFNSSEQFRELCFYHNSYAHMIDYKKDLASHLPQVPQELLAEQGITNFEEIETDYPMAVRRDFINSSIKGIAQNIFAMFDTNLPFMFKVGLLGYMVMRPIKYELKKYVNEKYMRRD